MRRELAETLMERLLAKRQFDFSRPSLPVAWAAFTEFVREPLEGVTTVTFGAEFSQVDDRDDILWVSFMRQVEEPGGGGWRCGCLLSRAAPKTLVGVHQSLWWWAGHGTVEQWIADAEQLPVFGVVAALDGWRWEGFSN